METPPPVPKSDPATPAHTAEAIRVLRQNWRAEKASAGVYRDLAEAEKNPSAATC